MSEDRLADSLFEKLAERDATIAALRAENAKLKTVMVAAAEEISAHWEAHCDSDGYGPQNLVRRLEEGIPSEYGYTAGAFAALRAEVERLEGFASLWYFVMDEKPMDFERIVCEYSPKRWMDEAAKLRAAIAQTKERA